MEEGLSDFRLYGPCNPRPNSPSLEYAELAWAHDAEAAHSCIVRGRHGSTEGLLNLFQPGKKNARQHRHVPRCTRASTSVVSARHVGARHFGLAARMMRGRCIPLPKLQTRRAGTYARLCPHVPTGASGVAGLAPSRQIAMTAAMIAGPTNNPIRPKVSKPPKMPKRTHRKGRRVDAPISAGRTK